MLRDIRYAFRTFRNAPLFAAGVAGTFGWGLGVICSCSPSSMHMC